MAKVFSPERRVASLVDRLRIWVSITCSTPSPAPRTYTGFLAQSLARSARVMTTAPPASVTRQMFKTLKGQTTGRESSTSCTVIGSRFLALGLRAAHLRVDTATCAHCSRVVPYSCMWRVVMRPNMVGAPPKPYGVSNCPGSAVSPRGHAHTGAPRFAMGDHRHVAEAVVEGDHGVADHDDEGAAADGGAVDVA